MVRKFLFAIALVGATAGTVAAQTAAETKGEIRVQVNIGFFVHGAVDGGEGSLRAQEDARRSLYQAAARECDVLKSSIASGCRLETLNVNINRSYGSPQNEGFNANGSFGFRVMLK